MEYAMRYGLDDKTDLYDGMIIEVFSADRKIAFKKNFIRDDPKPCPVSFRELLEWACVDVSKRDGGSVLIVIDSLLDGVIYQFGNYDIKNVYKYAETRGYA